MMRKTGMTSESRIRMVGCLHRAGVRLVSGSDGGINPGKRHGVLPEAVIQLVDGGVPAAAALTTATSHAAAACGLADCKGHVAAGFDADLLLIDGDPLADITTLRNIQLVYVRGHPRR
ncbi:MAG: amidohydrolase family protein [Actinomycetota bacterium]|nr:amidohydrolase family protein [Actinomycetota bacterium]